MRTRESVEPSGLGSSARNLNRSDSDDRRTLKGTNHRRITFKRIVNAPATGARLPGKGIDGRLPYAVGGPVE